MRTHVWHWQLGPLGGAMRRRLAIGVTALIVFILLLVTLAVFTGTLPIPVDRVLAALGGTASKRDTLVVIDYRLAPALGALLVGFALGCAGGLTQTITRNPIASPDILGVTSGAGAVVVFILTGPFGAVSMGGYSPQVLLAPVAIAGGILTSLLVLALSWRGGFDGLRLVLVGLAINSIALATTAWMLTRADIIEVQVAARWLTGSVLGITMSDLWLLAIATAVAIPMCIRMGQDLGALRLGRDVAAVVGTNPGRVELGALALAVGLTSIATAVAGPISFVAFVAPQLAMRVMRTAGPPPLVGGLMGAFILLTASQITGLLPGTLPVGVLTPLIGAPYLLFLMHQNVRRTHV